MTSKVAKDLVSVSVNLYCKSNLILEFSFKFDENLEVTSVQSFIHDFKKLTCDKPILHLK